MNELFFIYSILVTLSTLMTINSLNPIYAIFWLVLLFIFSSWLLILLDLEFFPLIIIIIYVGAMTILFLFVIMMLNIIELKKIESVNNSIPLIIIFICLFLIKLLFIEENNFDLLNYSKDWFINFNWKSQIQVISCLIYMDYYLPIFYISILLLIAMIGAIILSLEKSKKSKTQILSIQHSRIIY